METIEVLFLEKGILDSDEYSVRGDDEEVDSKYLEG
jgi:hypothetical protein